MKLLGAYKNQETNISRIRPKQKTSSPVFIARKPRWPYAKYEIYLLENVYELSC